VGSAAHTSCARYGAEEVRRVFRKGGYSSASFLSLLFQVSELAKKLRILMKRSENCKVDENIVLLRAILASSNLPQEINRLRSK
jgi:hypothetical protein